MYWDPKPGQGKASAKFKRVPKNSTIKFLKILMNYLLKIKTKQNINISILNIDSTSIARFPFVSGSTVAWSSTANQYANTKYGLLPSRPLQSKMEGQSR